MGYVLAWSACCNCGRIFGYNPHRVPSCRIAGVREPICRDCVERVNPVRVSKGLPRIVVQPDAYEALPEDEL